MKSEYALLEDSYGNYQVIRKDASRTAWVIDVPNIGNIRNGLDYIIMKEAQQEKDENSIGS